MNWSFNDLDPTDDFDIFDGVVDATFAHFNPTTDSHGSAFSVRALFREANRDDVALLRGTTTSEVYAVHIPRSYFTAEPQKLDKITHDGVSYVVQSLKRSTLGTRYRFLVSRV